MWCDLTKRVASVLAEAERAQIREWCPEACSHKATHQDEAAVLIRANCGARTESRAPVRFPEAQVAFRLLDLVPLQSVTLCAQHALGRTGIALLGFLLNSLVRATEGNNLWPARRFSGAENSKAT